MKCNIRLAEGETFHEVVVPDWWPPPGMWPDHVAFFCPITGVIWAWMEWLDPDAHGWIVRYVPAPGQPARHRAVVPGSLIPMDDDCVPTTFPPSLVEREFFVHAEYFKKGYHRL